MLCQEYMQPRSLEELQECLGKMDEKSKIMAGGTDLMIAFREKRPQLNRILSIVNVPELKGIEYVTREERAMVRIGALTSHARLADSPIIHKEFPAVAMAADHVGSQQIRNRGTIGGNLANASVGGDMVPLMVLLHAEMEIMNSNGEIRVVPMEEFLLGAGRTVLGSQDILLAVYIPVTGKSSCFHKLGARDEVTIADISLCLTWTVREGKLCQVEGVMGAVDGRPVWIDEVRQYLEGRLPEEMDEEGLAACLSDKIREIQSRRSRPSKLRIKECERNYKELAVRGVVADTLQHIRG